METPGLGSESSSRLCPLFSAGIVDELASWQPAMAILGFVSSQTGFSHHMRYTSCPLFFPFVIIATSKVACFVQTGHRLAGVLVVPCLLWAVASSMLIYPHSLSYFNETAGGPENGHAHLLDSNIDWGQDLLYLKDWLDKHPEAYPLGSAYFNTVDPGTVGNPEFELPAVGPGKPDDAGKDVATGFQLNWDRQVGNLSPQGWSATWVLCR